MRYALIVNGTVEAVVEQEHPPVVPGVWVEGVDAAVGYRYAAGIFSPPAPKTYGSTVTKLAFKARFPNPKWRAAKAAAAAGNGNLIDYFENYDQATYIDLASAQTQGSVLALTHPAVPVEFRLTDADAAAVLAHPVTDPTELPGSVRVAFGLPEIPA